ncbi:MAG: hypothetical protein JSS66_07115 [Armatimonadetes bacterium]|nr:hypothetical protein [Armatimonadota bacterium]
MTRIKCFLIEETDKVAIQLRRYSNKEPRDCPGRYKYHDAQVTIGEDMRQTDEKGYTINLKTPHDDPRWPVKCDYCDYVFTIDDEWQTNQNRLYVSLDPETPGKWTHRELPAGAMFFPSWLQRDSEQYEAFNAHGPRRYQPGPDGKILMVVTPGGEWIVDSRCSNCTMPDDNEHNCWIRHGEAPNITVDKNGHTCAAGGGSILAGTYHGFLRDGHLEEC